MCDEKKGILEWISHIFWVTVFLGGGLAFGGFIVYKGFTEFNMLLHWSGYKEITGVVEEPFVDSYTHTSMSHGTATMSTSRQIKAKYLYIVNRKHLTHTSVVCPVPSSHDSQPYLDKYKKGTVIKVWYHPDNINEPVVEYGKPDLANSIWFIIFGGLILLVGGGIIVGVIKDYFCKSEDDENEESEEEPEDEEDNQ
ncbi:MAG: hypothetical protein ACYTFY_08635 [Planctomycetota bacterium]|jgi:hypothetical protein